MRVHNCKVCGMQKMHHKGEQRYLKIFHEGHKFVPSGERMSAERSTIERSMKTKEIRKCIMDGDKNMEISFFPKYRPNGQKAIAISFYAKLKSKEIFELCYLDSEEIKILKKMMDVRGKK